MQYLSPFRGVVKKILETNKLQKNNILNRFVHKVSHMIEFCFRKDQNENSKPNSLLNSEVVKEIWKGKPFTFWLPEQLYTYICHSLTHDS